MSRTYKNRNLSLKLKKYKNKKRRSRGKKKDGIAGDDTLDYADTYTGDLSGDGLEEGDLIDDGFILEPEADESFEIADEEAENSDPPVLEYDYYDDYIEVVMSDETESGDEVDAPIDEFEEYYSEESDTAYCCASEDGCFLIEDPAVPTDDESVIKKKKSKAVPKEKAVIWCSKGSLTVWKPRQNKQTVNKGKCKGVEITFERRKKTKRPDVVFVSVGANSCCEIHRGEKVSGKCPTKISARKSRILKVTREKRKRLASVRAFGRPKSRNTGNEVKVLGGKQTIVTRRNRRGKVRAVSFMRGNLVIVIVGGVRF